MSNNDHSDYVPFFDCTNNHINRKDFDRLKKQEKQEHDWSTGKQKFGKRKKAK